ncbi:hypothetical protein C8R46DRAFT_1091822, partial [Mycena filopes]
MEHVFISCNLPLVWTHSMRPSIWRSPHSFATSPLIAPSSVMGSQSIRRPPHHPAHLVYRRLARLEYLPLDSVDFPFDRLSFKFPSLRVLILSGPPVSSSTASLATPSVISKNPSSLTCVRISRRIQRLVVVRSLVAVCFASVQQSIIHRYPSTSALPNMDCYYFSPILVRLV